MIVMSLGVGPVIVSTKFTYVSSFGVQTFTFWTPTFIICANPQQAIVARWYREQIKAVVPDLIARGEPILGVQVKRVFVQKMKTKWGSCNPRSRSIRLNTDLAKKPRECLEYIVVHEMVHLLNAIITTSSGNIWTRSCRNGVCTGKS